MSSAEYSVFFSQMCPPPLWCPPYDVPLFVFFLL